MSQLQTVVIVPQAEWLAVLARLNNLETRDQQPVPSAAGAADDAILNSREAAAYLGLTSSLSVTKARRQKRLAGLKINEKCWGFRRSELDRYLSRYQRPKPATTP